MADTNTAPLEPVQKPSFIKSTWEGMKGYVKGAAIGAVVGAVAIGAIAATVGAINPGAGAAMLEAVGGADLAKSIGETFGGQAPAAAVDVGSAGIAEAVGGVSASTLQGVSSTIIADMAPETLAHAIEIQTEIAKGVTPDRLVELTNTLTNILQDDTAARSIVDAGLSSARPEIAAEAARALTRSEMVDVVREATSRTVDLGDKATKLAVEATGVAANISRAAGALMGLIGGAAMGAAAFVGLGGLAGAVTGVVKSREVAGPSAEDVVNVAKISFAQGAQMGAAQTLQHVAQMQQAHEPETTKFRDKIAKERGAIIPATQTIN